MELWNPCFTDQTDRISSNRKDNHAVDANGNPVSVYQGEHGEPDEAPFQARQGTITVVNDRQVAGRYVMQPNDRRETPHAPRVFSATLDISNKVMNQPGDPQTPRRLYAASSSHRSTR